MKMFKKLFCLLAVAVLSLTSCTDGDEPTPTPTGGGSLYLATRELSGFPARIFDQHGNTIYKCEEGECIRWLVAEGSDWYALITRNDVTYRVVKNGKKIYGSDGKIWCFAVENGAFYLVLEDNDHKVWACKGWESQQDKESWYCQQLFEVNDGRLYNTFMVHDGAITMAMGGAEPAITLNETIHPMNEYLDHGFNWVYGIDNYAGTWLITYEDFETRKNMYWWKNAINECPQYFQPTTSRIVNGHAFILGQKTSSQGVGSIYGLPAVLIDGIETILSDDLMGFEAVGLASHGIDTYILVSHSTGSISCIYKNLKAIRLPDVKMPYVLSPYGSNYSQDGKTNLASIGITAIAVVDGTKEP